MSDDLAGDGKAFEEVLAATAPEESELMRSYRIAFDRVQNLESENERLRAELTRLNKEIIKVAFARDEEAEPIQNALLDQVEDMKRTAVARAEAAEARVKELEAQQHDLAEALKKLLPWAEGVPHGRCDCAQCEALARARAALGEEPKP